MVLKCCPLTLTTRDSWNAVRMANWCDKGILPEPGGLNDQFSGDVERIEAARSEFNGYERARFERLSKKHK